MKIVHQRNLQCNGSANTTIFKLFATAKKHNIMEWQFKMIKKKISRGKSYEWILQE